MHDTEVAELKGEIVALNSKVNTLTEETKAMASSVREIEKLLAKQEGQNIALRLLKAEGIIQELKTESAKNSWLPEQVEQQGEDLKSLQKGFYKILVGLAVIQTAMSVAVAILLQFWEKIF